MFKNRLMSTVVASVAAILVTAGIAFAAWSATGSGNGGAAATVAQGLTVTAFVPSGSGATLYPGATGSVDFSVSNPNPYAVTITGITWGTPTSLNTTACPNANLSIAAGAPTTVSISIPANSTGSSVFVEPGVLTLAHSAPDGCQGVGFNVPMTITGTQQ